jgi:hypothetical protein
MVVFTAWNLASPPGSGPDEAPHVVRAASIARGQLVGAEDPIEGGGSRVVHAPHVMASLYQLPLCWRGHVDVSAGCMDAFVGSTSLVDVRTPAGAAPPAYYLIPALALDLKMSSGGVLLARELSAMVCAALLAFAVGLIRLVRPTPFLTAAFFITLTPTMLFISSVVNPSALEIASALLLWVAVLLLASEPVTSVHRRRLVWSTAVGASIFVLSRQLSPLWLVLVALTFVIVAGWRMAWAVLRSRDGIAASVVIGVASLVAVVWLQLEAPLKSQNGLAKSLDTSRALSNAAGNLGYVYQTAVTGIGWLDFKVPQGALVSYSVAAGALLLIGVAAATRRLRGAILVMAIVTIVLPILIEASQYERLGQTWQGRYSWPLAVGVLLLCGLALDRSDLARSRTALTMTRILLGLVAFANALTFYFALRRYEVGIHGSVWFLGKLQWDPPVSATLILVVGLAGIVGLFVFADRLVLRLFGCDERPEDRSVSAAA